MQGDSLRAVKISLRGVRKAFRSEKGEIHVLDGIDLDIREREFFGIVGPSGCGKSTLLDCLAGFEPISSGTLLIDGQPVAEPSPKRVFVFQEPGIFPWLTVAENVGFGLLGRPEEERRETVARYVELVGLQGFEAAFPRELSGGMKQRVEFARALAVRPDVLFLDEPFGALDALTRLEMRREIVRIWQATRNTSILVTHDVDEAVQLSDRIAVMSRRPAVIARVFENRQPRPRDPDSRELLLLKDEIFRTLGVERGG